MAELHLELFWQPYLAGLLLALLLPLLGIYLRLRQEWLAALAYGQVGAAGALLALALGVPPALGGVGASLVAALGKQRLRCSTDQGVVFALLLLLGWGGGVLLTANLPMAERLGHALFEGQLYFADRQQLYLALGALMAGGLFLARFSRSLLLARLYPGYFQGRGMLAWPVHLGFDLLVAASLAIAVMSLGVMAAFALVFIPPWVAFARARGWRQAHILAMGLSLVIYTLAFIMALYWDQVFGPVLALLLVVLGILANNAHSDGGNAMTKVM